MAVACRQSWTSLCPRSYWLLATVRVKKGVKTTFVYFEKTAIKDLRFSLRVFFFKYTNKKHFFGSLGVVRMFLLFAILLGVSRLFLDYEYCELPTRRMQKEVKVYDEALLVRGWKLYITQGIYLDCNTSAADSWVIVRYSPCKSRVFTSKCFNAFFDRNPSIIIWSITHSVVLWCQFHDHVDQ